MLINLSFSSFINLFTYLISLVNHFDRFNGRLTKILELSYHYNCNGEDSDNINDE